MVNILITGRPGIGKTTAIRRILDLLPRQAAGGFYSQEIREKGSRVGFEIVSLHGGRGILAHVDLPGPSRVGKYTVDIDSIEKYAVQALEMARKFKGIIIVDEIAKMELYVPNFAPEVSKCLDTGRVVGTIQLRSHEFLDEVRNRDDVEILTITEENRDEAPARVLTKMGLI